jgi:hypothetical protein
VRHVTDEAIKTVRGYLLARHRLRVRLQSADPAPGLIGDGRLGLDSLVDLVDLVDLVAHGDVAVFSAVGQSTKSGTRSRTRPPPG